MEMAPPLHGDGREDKRFITLKLVGGTINPNALKHGSNGSPFSFLNTLIIIIMPWWTTFFNLS